MIMGQYYKGINLDKREFIKPHDYGNGAKLMEHSYIENTLLDTVEHLFSPKGHWHKTRFVWAGDYMDEGLFIEPLAQKGNIRALFPKEDTLYEYASEHFKTISEKKSYDPTLRFIVNHTKKEYVDKEKVRTGEYDMKIHPLPLLTSSGNGRGGGDYHDDSSPYVGSWAGDVISMETSIPDGYKEIVPDFLE